MRDTGDYSISELAELFSISRPTVYRTLARQFSPNRVCALPTHASACLMVKPGKPHARQYVAHWASQEGRPRRLAAAMAHLLVRALSRTSFFP